MMLSIKKADPSYKKINSACLILLAATAATAALIYTKAFMMPLVISLLVYVVLMPLVRLMTNKLKIPKIIAVTITFALIVGLFTLVTLFISKSVNDFIAGANAYSDRMSTLFAWLTETAKKYNLDLNFATFADALSALPVFDIVKGMGRGLLVLITNASLCFIILIFFFVGSAVQEMPGKYEHIIKEVQNRISYYMIIKTAVSLVTGLTIWLILHLFGVELAALFGFLVFILNFIPNVGSIISTLLPVPVIFIQFGWEKLLIILALKASVQFLIGNVIEPKIVGDGMDLHPVVVLCSLVFWGLVWGIPGAFLAVPMTVAVKIGFSYLKPTKQVAEFMAGRF